MLSAPTWSSQGDSEKRMTARRELKRSSGDLKQSVLSRRAELVGVLVIHQNTVEG